ncbi:hypothetical protein DRI50_02480 [candidate division KSB1 bacterium]|nr:MAG: hypothetical protein DRI50_02480 [candidate division KSB1 bacterium]
MNSILIRAEDKNKWERRTPIVPEDLKSILKETPTKAYVERSDKRFFKESEYEKAGAEICEGMEKGDVIFGVKEIPEQKILDNKTYLFFSHTIKGQKYNMPLLQRIIDSGSTLIDYEKITDEKGRRLVYFGRYAGDAGAIDILWLLGQNWKQKGMETPFAKIKQALHYHSVEEAHTHAEQIGNEIREQGLPDEVQPLVIGILGYGNVSKGAQYILEALPTKRVEPEELADLVNNKNFSKNTIYMVVFKEEHLVEHNEGKPFDLQDYYRHPEHYHSVFDRYLPYLSVLINAIYWEARYPRFVTWQILAELETQGKLRLQAIADISCDPNGSIECDTHCTDSGNPAYRIHPGSHSFSEGYLGDGIIVLAVDNLPAELPNDSSRFFSKLLRPFIPGIIKADFSKSLEESGLPEEIKRAVIVYNGQLTPNFQYLKEYLQS